MTPVKIAPSLLAADFSQLEQQIRLAEDAGADELHLDVMDGHFVPNLTFGPLLVEAVRRLTRLPLDVHLMITDPDRYLDRFVSAGADRIDVHLEPLGGGGREADRMADILERLQGADVQRGLALNPETPPEAVDPYMDKLDTLLVMTVHPGFGGQALIPDCLEKIPALCRRINQQGRSILVGVDGGIHPGNAQQARGAGAGLLIAGSAFFQAEDPAAVVRAMRASESDGE